MTEALSASFRVQEAEPETVPSLSWIPAKNRLVCSSRWSQRLTLLAGRAAVLLKHIWRRGSLNSPHIVFLRLLTLRYLAGMLTRASRICWEFLAPSLALSFLSSPLSVLAVLTGACTVALWDLFFFLSNNPPSQHSPHLPLFQFAVLIQLSLCRCFISASCLVQLCLLFLAVNAGTACPCFLDMIPFFFFTIFLAVVLGWYHVVLGLVLWECYVFLDMW